MTDQSTKAAEDMWVLKPQDVITQNLSLVPRPYVARNFAISMGVVMKTQYSSGRELRPGLSA
jgi:hypothetical protein